MNKVYIMFIYSIFAYLLVEQIDGITANCISWNEITNSNKKYLKPLNQVWWFILVIEKGVKNRLYSVQNSLSKLI